MRIENRPIDLYRPDTAKGADPVKGVGSVDRAATQSTGGSARSDQVQISDAGRALAAGVEGKQDGLSAERVAQIRQRIYEGAYDSMAVVDQVAQRMLQAGDI